MKSESCKHLPAAAATTDKRKHIVTTNKAAKKLAIDCLWVIVSRTQVLVYHMCHHVKIKKPPASFLLP